MKKHFLILPLLSLLVVAGFGCTKPNPITIEEVASTNEAKGSFKSEDFGFTFSYPTYLLTNEREQENWAFTYLGKDMLFFSSLKDTTRGNGKPENILYMYAWPKADANDFDTALKESDSAVTITSREDLQIGEANMTRFISTNSSETPKTHYVWEHEGNLIVFSVFLGEEGVAEPVLRTVQSLKK